jgi:hypothetical protein
VSEDALARAAKLLRQFPYGVERDMTYVPTREWDAINTLAESRQVKYEHLLFLIESHNATCRMACNGADFLIQIPAQVP